MNDIFQRMNQNALHADPRQNDDNRQYNQYGAQHPQRVAEGVLANFHGLVIQMVVLIDIGHERFFEVILILLRRLFEEIIDAPETNQLNQFRQGGLDGGWGGNSVRLDTRWEETRPDALLRWQFGDGITDGGTGMRSIRFGGLRIGTDFDLQPYRTTSTLPTWFGSVALPSTVDVYIDGMRRYHAQVPPGAVALDAVPGITGSGQASVVVTDALGRMQTFEFPFYSTTRLLQPGLSTMELPYYEMGRTAMNLAIDGGEDRQVLRLKGKFIERASM